MRRAFAHDAVVAMGESEDERAAGAAITVALCGSIDHAPPCPLAPHHISTHRTGDEVMLRILFAAEPGSEAIVRSRIEAALRQWPVRSSGASEVRDAERDHAARLMAT